MRGFLVPCSALDDEKTKTKIFDLPDLGTTTIGRSLSSSIVCSDQAVSSVHCIIRSLGEEGFELEDSSRNGTFWNEMLVVKGQRVHLEAGGILALCRVDRPGTRFRLQKSMKPALRRMIPLQQAAAVPSDEGAELAESEGGKLEKPREEPDPTEFTEDPAIFRAPGEHDAVKGIDCSDCPDWPPPAKPACELRRPLLVLPGHTAPLKRPRPNFSWRIQSKRPAKSHQKPGSSPSGSSKTQALEIEMGSDWSIMVHLIEALGVSSSRSSEKGFWVAGWSRKMDHMRPLHTPMTSSSQAE